MAPAGTVARTAIVGAAFVLSLTSRTVAADDGGFFIGADYLHTLSSYRQTDISNDVVNSFAAGGYTLKLKATSLERDDSNWSAHVGYMFTPYFGLEAGYLDLGTLKYQATATETSYFGASPVAVRLDISSRGPILAIPAVLPLTEAWEIDGRVGAYEGRTNTDYFSRVGTGTTSGSMPETSTSLLLGVGTAYAFALHWSLRVGFTYLNHLEDKLFDSNFNVKLVSAGVSYVF
jgi:OmpA-OmpF porin, OOP family